MGEGDILKIFANERKELRADFRREIDEQSQVIAELHQEIAEQKKENAKHKEEVKILHKKLHQADLKNEKAHLEKEKAHRQRDAKQSQELEAKIRSAIRQERHSSDLQHVVESFVEKTIFASSKNSRNSS